MASKLEKTARARLQARVSKVVWGVLFIAAGLLLTLDDQGAIDLAGPAVSRHPARYAVDGNPKTRWSSAFRDPEWITIDLGAPAEITRVRLSWEKAYATAYRIQVSSDGSAWTTVKDVTDGHGGIEELDVAASGRYVRLEGITRATPWGFSLFEFEVSGTTEDTGSTVSLLSSGKPATASSLEKVPFGYFSLYWPVLLVAGGLPLLLVPKDAGEQVIGLFMAGIGVFLQLQNLGRVPWSFAQAWPVLLVLAGFLLVTQALAQRNRSSDDGTPTGGAGFGGGAS